MGIAFGRRTNAWEVPPMDEPLEPDVDLELKDMSDELFNVISLVGRLSLLGFMRRRGAVQGLRHFARVYDIKIKDKNASIAKLISRVTKDLQSAESRIHEAAFRAIETEQGRGSFPNALASLGLETMSELGLAVYSGYCMSTVSTNVTEAVEARQRQSGGQMSVSEAVIATSLLSLVERYLKDSGFVEAVVTVERAKGAERERDKLASEVKRLRRLVQEQKAEIGALGKARTKQETMPRHTPSGEDREEIRALRRENYDLRKQLEEMERELRAAPAPQPEVESRFQETSEQASALATPTSAPDFSVVQGKRVLVVGGDSKEDVYREIVQDLGGEYSFLPGFYGQPIGKEDVEGFDGLIFVSTQLRHAVFDRVKGHAKALGIPFRILTFKGNEAFMAAMVDCLSSGRGSA